jgi:hypothetical protein
MNHFLERGRERSQSLHGDDSIVFFRICDICHSVKHNLCYRTPWSRFGLRISFVPLRFDATRSAATSADNRRTTSPCRKVGRSVNARRAFPTSTGDLRPAAPSTATAPKLAQTVAREVPAAPRTRHRGSRLRKRTRDFLACNALKRRKTWKFSQRPRTGWELPAHGRGGSPLAAVFACAGAIAIDTRGALKGRQGKFSCLQRIEKARNVKMFAATEDALGATDRERGGSFARRTICMRPRHRHRRARRPEKRHAKIFLPATH